MGAIIPIIEQLKWSLTLLYTDSTKEVNDKDPKFKVGDDVTISKHKRILLKDIFQIGLKKFL